MINTKHHDNLKTTSLKYVCKLKRKKVLWSIQKCSVVIFWPAQMTHLSSRLSQNNFLTIYIQCTFLGFFITIITYYENILYGNEQLAVIYYFIVKTLRCLCVLSRFVYVSLLNRSQTEHGFEE